MRILVVGSTGTIGKAVVDALSSDHEIVAASLNHGLRVDISDSSSIRRMFEEAGTVDAVVSAAGEAARRKPWPELSDEDFDFTLRNKLMGQINLVRYGIDSVRDGGSFTLTSGVLARQPMPGSAALTLVNLGLEGFVKAAALEMPRGIRINVVSPPWLTETLEMLGMTGVAGLPARTVAKAYVASVTGNVSGRTLEPLGD
jgi:NAD(P)-dependent dehydrogenase (short-subunit alcohol dehydrogenase family)